MNAFVDEYRTQIKIALMLNFQSGSRLPRRWARWRLR
jgi:hypothetical protein